MLRPVVVLVPRHVGPDVEKNLVRFREELVEDAAVSRQHDPLSKVRHDVEGDTLVLVGQLAPLPVTVAAVLTIVVLLAGTAFYLPLDTFVTARERGRVVGRVGSGRWRCFEQRFTGGLVPLELFQLPYHGCNRQKTEFLTSGICCTSLTTI